jgi:hypothetical protein
MCFVPKRLGYALGLDVLPFRAQCIATYRIVQDVSYCKRRASLFLIKHNKNKILSESCRSSFYEIIFSFHIPLLVSFIQRIRPDPKLVQIIRKKFIFYGKGLLASRPPPEAGGPPHVVCPQLLIQYIRSCPP